ncbi:hypothetical protein QGM71_02765 [Virgibacillus sp. C22-A2]|uniref:YozE SAM-like domain-containing protein n=1 Tax=Virgibacillus tibetensis TaxID=3042313 RepID=A0ABU6KAI5_9BACI|nr:hypothetical protein [Virgibacillus sp. C22-A2]MEC5422412.1 hypothetical protein [Virgibacillus sp. C22-A2]
MNWFKSAYDVTSGKRKSNWAYDNLEYSPYLHPPHMLKNMYSNANHEQKASILKHISDHEMQDFGEWKEIANQIWDDYK